MREINHLQRFKRVKPGKGGSTNRPLPAFSHLRTSLFPRFPICAGFLPASRQESFNPLRSLPSVAASFHSLLLKAFPESVFDPCFIRGYECPIRFSKSCAASHIWEAIKSLGTSSSSNHQRPHFITRSNEINRRTQN